MNRLAWNCLAVALAAALLAPLADGQTGAEPPRIELRSSGDAQTFDVVGLSPAELAAFEKLPAEKRTAALGVFVAGELDDPPPVAGSVKASDGLVRFTPRYPLEPGVTYHVVFDRVALGAGNTSSSPAAISAVFPLAKSDAEPTTVVEHIYPSGDVLPENQLKFYLHFSAPMSRGEAYRHIHLLDAAGQELEAVFLELGEELWDGDHRRFTLLCDPGRVKRGLKPREELGSVLTAGESYTLVVDGDWRDARRMPLNAGARKGFSVGPPDETPIDPARWQISPPVAGSHAPLVVRFGEPLDHSLLERIVWVTNSEGKKLAGTIATGDDEACWQFTPAEPWPAGRYKLLAETTLEDLAGNAIGRPFEVDEFDQVDRAIETKTIELPFTVGEP